MPENERLLKDLEYLPRPNLVVFRETEEDYWSEAFLAKMGGAVRVVYLYDASTVTHCCEITPSYELRFVDLLPERYPDNGSECDAIDELLDENRRYLEEYHYRHCSGIDSIPDDRRKVLAPPDEKDLESTYDEYMEEVYEDVRCNRYF